MRLPFKLTFGRSPVDGDARRRLDEARGESGPGGSVTVRRSFRVKVHPQTGEPIGPLDPEYADIMREMMAKARENPGQTFTHTDRTFVIDGDVPRETADPRPPVIVNASAPDDHDRELGRLRTAGGAHHTTSHRLHVTPWGLAAMIGLAVFAGGITASLFLDGSARQVAAIVALAAAIVPGLALRASRRL
jgi:hypothetical protein